MTSVIREGVARRWAATIGDGVARRCLLTAMAALLAAGCAGAAGEAGGAAASRSPTPRANLDAQTPTPDVGEDETAAGTEAAGEGGEDAAMTIDPALDRIVALAVADLASRQGVNPDQITVVLAEAVTWSDASLGCPQPNVRYIQVPQDGARIHLEVDDQLYRYHTGGRRTEPFLCEPGINKRPRTTRTLEPRLPDQQERS